MCACVRRVVLPVRDVSTLLLTLAPVLASYSSPFTYPCYYFFSYSYPSSYL